LNASDVRGRCLNLPYVNVLIDSTRYYQNSDTDCVGSHLKVTNNFYRRSRNDELRVSAVSCSFSRNSEKSPSPMQANNSRKGGDTSHLTLRVHPRPTYIFTCVSGLLFSSDFLSRDNDNLRTLFRNVDQNILSTLKLAFAGNDTTRSDSESLPLA
jgi:hypothetical protein